MERDFEHKTYSIIFPTLDAIKRLYENVDDDNA